MGTDDVHDIELTGYGARLVREALETWDMSRIVVVLRDGGPVPQEVRDLLADMLEGTVKRGRGRARDADYREAAVQSYAAFMREISKGGMRDYAYDAAAAETGRSRRTVIAQVKFVENGGAPIERLAIEAMMRLEGVSK